MRRFLDRACAGFRWRRRYPQASKSEIREFLDLFVQAFGFRRRRRLYFVPNDRVMDIYRTLYPVRGMPDGMELEILVRDLQGNGLKTFLEHWGFLLNFLITVAAAQVLMFFINLSGEPWIYFFCRQHGSIGFPRGFDSLCKGSGLSQR